MEPSISGSMFRQRSSEGVPLEILSIYPSKERKHRDGQVDRQVFIALETLEGCLDGRVAVVHHERRAKTKPPLPSPDSTPHSIAGGHQTVHKISSENTTGDMSDEWIK